MSTTVHDEILAALTGHAEPETTAAIAKRIGRNRVSTVGAALDRLALLGKVARCPMLTVGPDKDQPRWTLSSTQVHAALRAQGDSPNPARITVAIGDHRTEIEGPYAGDAAALFPSDATQRLGVGRWVVTTPAEQVRATLVDGGFLRRERSFTLMDGNHPAGPTTPAKKMTRAQTRVARVISESQDGLLHYRGGPWSVVDGGDWSTTAQTVRAMEAAGWLERSGSKPAKPYADPRRLTPAGKAALAAAFEPQRKPEACPTCGKPSSGTPDRRGEHQCAGGHTWKAARR